MNLDLKEKDIKVLSYMVDEKEYTSAFIADFLGVSEIAIKSRRSKMMQRNKIKSMNRLVYLATKMGLI